MAKCNMQRRKELEKEGVRGEKVDRESMDAVQ